jgi:NAD(P)-dependent dehydrogenase (short-subunit alcohol dehydrogenase family)
MAEKFGATSTTDNVLSGVDLRGKRILVTGVSAGLGVETARSLAAHGASVIGAARDLEKAKGAIAEARRDAAAAGGSIDLVSLDLASLASVRSCADKLQEEGKPLDVIITNAGVMATPFGKTADGFETQFGTNHLGHFVLVNRLASLISSGGRVIALASSGEPFFAYGRSKTANILFAVAFDQRHRARGVRAAAVHPGGIHTELARHMDEGQMTELLARINSDLAAQEKAPFQFKTLPQGAATSVWAAVVASGEDIGGRYCENCHVSEVVADDVVITPVSEGVRRYALDAASADALWRKSEEMVGESF